MTQLDLPPISFARYLELLKRRRWQVIPMSVLGLVVGAVVAFFIPRYYVASTTVVYTGAVLEEGSKDDLYRMVRGAQLSVISAIPETAEGEGLQWVGTNVDDPVRQAILDELKARTTVISYQPDRESSDYQVTIEFRDQDGPRSALFANALRDTWTSGLMEQFNEKAGILLSRARGEVKTISDAGDAQVREINVFRREKGLERGEEGLGQGGAESPLKADLRREETRITEIEANLVRFRTRIGFLEHSVSQGFIPRKILKKVPLTEDSQLGEQIRKLAAAVAYHQLARDSWNPGTPLHDYHHRAFVAVQRQLKEIAPLGAASGMRTEEIDNPKYGSALDEISEATGEVTALEAELEVYQQAAANHRARLAALPEIWQEYESRLAQLDELVVQKADANDRVRRLEERYRRANTIRPFKVVSRAVVPQTPTDPDVTLVALAGSLLGLAVAIGLILLLDVLRSSFKTVDDVNYGLKLPVLGVMSYLETEEIRAQTVRQRRVIGIIVSVFLFLILSIVTVYFVAPTRLPPSILQLLDAILSPAESSS